MKSATALRVLPRMVTFQDPVEPALGQVPLPFPDQSPVVPAPIERDPVAGTTVLRQKSGHFVQALVEVLAGDRPVRQLAAWMSPDVYDQLAQRLVARAKAPRRAGPTARARVVSVHLSMVDSGHAEIAARFIHGRRSRAMAIRLEFRHNHRGVAQWLCTAVVWG